ncbi:UNVERIFIED_CONTAM: hypothetical protein Sangu_1355000 [Sesamum angustifolium]|uniref:Uncharacterized protein n=1 Tax=Sesamum angustifolium TaxID=2727405 RepID=A0AAW2N403_9LAMI
MDLFKGNVSGASKAEASTHADTTPNGTESVTGSSQAIRRKSTCSKSRKHGSVANSDFFLGLARKARVSWREDAL